MVAPVVGTGVSVRGTQTIVTMRRVCYDQRHRAAALTERGKTMCEEKEGCQKPEELQGDPKECSPEQIRKCHGDVEGHPCVKAEDEE